MTTASLFTYDGTRAKSEFHNYDSPVRPQVRQFYKENHVKQTYEFVVSKERQWLGLNHKQMTVWEALHFLDTLVDDSDPDTDLSQIEHCFQTAEDMRKAGMPRWMIFTGLIHDLGKILCLFGEPQWCVVGDIFPVGCAYSDKIVYPEYFMENPDYNNPQYQTLCGIYQENCGLRNVKFSFGHDEYLYRVVKRCGSSLPEEALYCIRYHSFYSWHTHGAYGHLCDAKDRQMREVVKTFVQFDLYSKGQAKPNIEETTPFYKELIDEFIPGTLNF